ncbi:pitrilysin family protein [Sphingosinicella sp. YJ22]|uniref:M16 family metallopeptidase n=1 Tax=Sphingosinicella sp. YJ22 TaxID=1104780 RepID=UPI00140C9A48|nr:pitrilysin family protein [Sphingosinicella sp. YJ22]
MRHTLLRLALVAGVTFSAPFANAEDAASTATAAAVQPGAAGAATPQELVRQVRIPYETFTLDNGLRVVVHEDRKAPVVAVSIWYNVGSKDEPEGRTGFAHLFEHLMFNGSENAPGEYFEYTRAMGATDLNGTTWFDRTNYFQTVPRPALERSLFLEADRMGHLLGAVTQENLTNQIGVVQNEKRQGDNEPFGLVEYAQLEALFPEGHPYRHSTIGSMADLSAATMDTVREWFRDNYGPNNAVLVLAGDINAAEARPLVERYFGDIPRGPVNEPAQASVPTLPRRVDQTMRDRVANTRLYRDWVVPGLLHEDIVPLTVGAMILGGLDSSRLDNQLVREDQNAVRVASFVQDFHRVSMFEVQVDVKPGEDANAVSRQLDQIITDYVTRGPTDDEVRRAVMRILSSRVQGLEQVGGFGGKAVALAEGMLYANDPNFVQTRLEQLATVTPTQVRDAMRRWLRRPVYALTVVPGEREAYEEAPGVRSRTGGVNVTTPSQRPRYYRTPQAGEQPLAPVHWNQQQPTTQRPLPPIGTPPTLDFPDVERARLSNGIEVVYARRNVVPVTRMAVEFDAGTAADPANRLGTQALMLNLLEEGTTRLNSTQLAEAQERLGATIFTGASLDRTTVGLSALTPNLAPSLDLLADVIRNPAFAPAEVNRVRQQQLAQIASELTQPSALAARALPVVLFGNQHPYGKPGTGTGSAEVVSTLTRDELIRFHQSWIRPDNARIFVVSDLPLAQLVPQLESRLGNWTAPAVPRGVKTFPQRGPETRSRIVLVDRPQSPQSIILAGQLLDVVGTADTLALNAANQVLGGDFLARINMELRERRGWSYGARGSVGMREHQLPYVIQAPVQSDRTADSIRAIQEQLRMFFGDQGVQPNELQRVIAGSTGTLPGQFETSPAVLSALQSNALYRRPDNYWETVADRYRAMTAEQLDRTIRETIDPDDFVWVVVGDAARVRPQLETLGMPIEEMRLAPAAPVQAAAPRPSGQLPVCSRTVTDRCVQRGGR